MPLRDDSLGFVVVPVLGKIPYFLRSKDRAGAESETIGRFA
jgi:hypothetical protein